MSTKADVLEFEKISKSLEQFIASRIDERHIKGQVENLKIALLLAILETLVEIKQRV